jgi:hypothetical protein
MDWFVSWILTPAIFLSMPLLSFKMGHARFMNAFRRFAAYWFACLGTIAVVGTIAVIVWPSSVEESQAPNLALSNERCSRAGATKSLGCVCSE